MSNEADYREVLEEVSEIMADMGWHADRGVRMRVLDVLRRPPSPTLTDKPSSSSVEHDERCPHRCILPATHTGRHEFYASALADETTDELPAKDEVQEAIEWTLRYGNPHSILLAREVQRLAPTTRAEQACVDCGVAPLQTERGVCEHCGATPPDETPAVPTAQDLACDAFTEDPFSGFCVDCGYERSAHRRRPKTTESR